MIGLLVLASRFRHSDFGDEIINICFANIEFVLVISPKRMVRRSTFFILIQQNMSIFLLTKIDKGL